jgi:hypothetical protein
LCGMAMRFQDILMLLVFIEVYCMMVGGTLGAIVHAGWSEEGDSGTATVILGVLGGTVLGVAINAIVIWRHAHKGVAVNQDDDEEKQALKDEKARLKAEAAAEKARLKAEAEAEKARLKAEAEAAKAAAAAKAGADAEAARLAQEEADKMAAMNAEEMARLERERAEREAADAAGAAAARLEAVMAKKAGGEKLMADGEFAQASKVFAEAMAMPDGELMTELPGLKEEADRRQAELEALDQEAAAAAAASAKAAEEAAAAAKAAEEAAAKREKVLQLVEDGKAQMEAENFHHAHKHFHHASELPDALEICPELPELIDEATRKEQEKKEEELRLVKAREKILGTLQEWKWYCGNELSPILKINKLVPKKEKPICYRIHVVRDESATFLDNFVSMYETATGPDGDGEWDPPLESAVMQYNLKYGIKGFMAAKKLLCWLMSIHYYTATKGKECPECRLLARIFGLFQPAPDHQTELLKDTLTAYATHRAKADVISVRACVRLHAVISFLHM